MLAAGMDDFLAKPIQEPDLWTAIDHLVGKQRESETDSDLIAARSCYLLRQRCKIAKLCDDV